jgi:hypothetical protein
VGSILLFDETVVGTGEAQRQSLPGNFLLVLSLRDEIVKHPARLRPEERHPAVKKSGEGQVWWLAPGKDGLLKSGREKSKADQPVAVGRVRCDLKLWQSRSVTINHSDCPSWCQMPHARRAAHCPRRDPHAPQSQLAGLVDGNAIGEGRRAKSSIVDSLKAPAFENIYHPAFSLGYHLSSWP